VTPAQLLLRYQALADRERVLRESIELTESRLTSDPALVEHQEALDSAHARREAVAARLRDSDREREGHRANLHKRERELMSGRIRNPTELMQMSEEVAHMKARFAAEEEAELTLMEEAEAADAAVRDAQAQLDSARKQSAEEEPELRSQLEEWRGELTEVVGEKDTVWAQIPAQYQALFGRVRVRPVVAAVRNNQCSACHVTVTSSGMQALRKGETPVQCENCGRILVNA
jgi:predicted  nucleic acid-binding Zn-ribbon protein